MNTWTRRNLPWLLALIPVLAFTTFTASHRFLTLYLPWEPSRPHHATAGQVELHQRYRIADRAFERTVTVQLLEVTAVRQFEHARAAEGAQLWRVDLRFTAAPDQLLTRCSLTLRSGGVSYSAVPAQVMADSQFVSRDSDYCVPAATPGPDIDYFADLKIIENTPPRPASWETSTAFALPQGVTPDEVHLYWTPPDYLVFPVTVS